MKGVSVVTLVHNEAEVIEGVIRGIHKSIISKMPDSEIIVCEDGSTDGTKEILVKLRKDIPFQLYMGSERKGYTRALRDALSLAKGEFIFFTDSDAQHNPEDFWKLSEKIADHDLVTGYKLDRKDGLFRSVISKSMNTIIGILFGLWIRDINCGFKLFRRELIDEILKEKWFFPDCIMTELVIRIHKMRGRIIEVPVEHRARLGVSRSLPFSRLPKSSLGVLSNLIKLKLSIKQGSKKTYA